MVLDLVLQPAEEEPDDPTAADVAGHEHLAPQEVGSGGGGHDGHPDVVRRERTAEQRAEDRELDGEEHRRAARRQEQEERGDVPAEPDGEQHRLERPLPHRRPAHDPRDALDVQVDALQRQQREEPPALAPGAPRRTTRCGRRPPPG